MGFEDLTGFLDEENLRTNTLCEIHQYKYQCFEGHKMNAPQGEMSARRHLCID